MLSGDFRHSIDTKGRVFLPAKFREDLGKSLLIVKGLDKHLTIYSEAEWKEYNARLIAALGEMKSKEILRFLTKGSSLVEPDSQGRIFISQELREYSGIEKEIVFMGFEHYVEAWNGAELDKETEKYDPESMKKLLSDIGF